MNFIYLIKRHDGKEVTVHESRHEAVGARARYHSANDYEIIPLRTFTLLDWTPRCKQGDNRLEPYSKAKSLSG